MRTREAILAFAAVGCADAKGKPVLNPELCKARVEARLGGSWLGEMPMNQSQSYPQLIFDGVNGDQKLARDFMWQNGFWPAMNAPGEKDFAFLAFTDPKTSPQLGDPSKSVELACRASWISKVPFIAVEIRAKSNGELLKKVIVD